MAVIKRKKPLLEEKPAKAPRTPSLHDELVDRACRWLKGTCGCTVSAGELRAFTGSGEIPDAIGWRAEYSILVECKTSRSDFFADRDKIFRIESALGVGDYRFYLCPPGVIEPSELPENWGLLYAEESRIRKVVCPTGNIWTSGENRRFIHDKNKDAEIAMLVSALRRQTG